MTASLLATSPAPLPLTAGGHTFQMVPVPAGTFSMGDEQGNLHDACRPVHTVHLDDFCLGQFPVTQGLWRAVAEASAGGIDPDPSYFKGDRRPVETVSWDDVQVFLQRLNEILPSYGFRMPTEAEWEYAARGGAEEAQAGLRHAGSQRLETVGWWYGNSHEETRPLGLKIPNALGLFDMSGNVWEWCADWYDSKFYEKCAAQGTVKNPMNEEKGSSCVLRGGSWLHPGLSGQGCRVAYRGDYAPTDRDDNFGFRLAALPPSQWPGP